jgi:hypothetical protein
MIFNNSNTIAKMIVALTALSNIMEYFESNGINPSEI